MLWTIGTELQYTMSKHWKGRGEEIVKRQLKGWGQLYELLVTCVEYM